MTDNENRQEFNIVWEDFSVAGYCAAKCTFYNACNGNRESCIKNAILSSFETLTKTEQVILKLSFSFCGNKHFSLCEIAELLDLTPERVRQITAKALRKLNHPFRRREKACLEKFDRYKQLTAEVWS